MTYNGLFATNAILLAVLFLTGLAFFVHRAHAATGKEAASVASASKVRVLGLAFGLKDSRRYEEVTLPNNAQVLPLLQASRNIDPQARPSSKVLVVNDSALSGDNIGASGVADDNSAFVPTSDQISLYTVRPGDTLEQIAFMYDVNVSTIRLANDLTPSEKIQPDQVLVILPVAGVKYTTKAKGDTIARIAKSYGADVSRVAEFNNIASNESLAANFTVIIPDVEDSLGHSDAKKPGTTAKPKPKTVITVKTGGAGYFSCPVRGAVMTQGIHGGNGVDVAASLGSPIYAAADGQVIIARSGGWGGGYGTYVVIKHPNGMQTLYGHMNSISVSVGDRVAKGQKIGGMGNTGDSSGIHLHYEVRGGPNVACNGLKRVY